MNKQILKFANKAVEDLPGAWNIPDEFCEKFANLIIEECVNACLEEADKFRGEQDITDFKICAMVIKERFET